MNFMGVAITELLKSRPISIKELEGKILAVDAPLWIYQFLSSIRQRDGTLLTDSKGNVTSHLVGISSRVPNLLEQGLKLIFCFDGQSPDLKRKEREKRKELKMHAQKRYEEAKAEEDLDQMKKYAARTSRLTSEMIEEAKALLEALGVPVVESATEAEAQAAFLVKQGEAYAVASNDADSLLFGAPRIIRNLNIVGKKKQAGAYAYKDVNPELIELKENLAELGLDRDQLIVLSMLVGTDYNVGGIKGIGPKKAIALTKKHKKNYKALFEEVKWPDSFDYDWKEVFDLIKNMKVSEKYTVQFGNPDPNKLDKVLVEKHDFSGERVEKIMERLKRKTKQKGLSEFFG